MNTPAPPTYPARPLNGGPLEVALPKQGDWRYEPKYNGWRALVHIPTGTMFNRHGERLTIEGEFGPALKIMRSTLDAQAFQWADCEALERRHKIGRGVLIVLDVVPEAALEATYLERRQWLESVLPVADLNPIGVGMNSVGLPPNQLTSDPAWHELQCFNRRLGCEFYEGLVAKRADSPYPLQLHSPARNFPYWVKHRWVF